MLLVLAGWTTVAQAQWADTDSYTFPFTKIENVGGAVLDGPNRVVLVDATYPKRGITQVEQHWLDHHLRLRHRNSLQLRGRLELASVAGTAHYMLLQLTSRDSLVLATVDTAGHLVAQVRQPLTARRKLVEVSDYPLPQGDVFLTSEQDVQQKTCRLVCRGPNLAVRWEKTFGPDATMTASAADSTTLWVVLMADYLGRHPVSTAVCLDLATGQERSRVALTNEQARRVPSVVEMGPGHSLLVAGHAFDGEAAVLRRSGDLFFQRLSPSGQVLANHLTNFEHEPTLHGAAAERVQWQLLWPAAHGQVQLVGETYTCTSAGEQILANSLSMGLAGQTVLRPKDVVSLRLNAEGKVEQMQVVPLPFDKGFFTWPYFAQGRVMADMASKAGVFRTRGLLADSATVVLRSPQQIQTLNIDSGQLSLVQPTPETGEAEVMYIGKNFVIIGEVNTQKRSMLIKRLPI